MAYGTLTTDTAWLLGLIAGDGCVQDHHIDITFGPGHDMPMAREAKRVLMESGWPVSSVNIKMVPKQPPRQPCLVLYAYGTPLVEELQSYGSFGLQEWRVPDAVLCGSADLQGAWIGGLTDADGHVQHIREDGKRNVSIDSTNAMGLDQVSSMLTGLGVDHRRYTHDRGLPGCAPQHKIHVCNRRALERFAEVVHLRCPRKRAALKAALSSYQRDILTSDEVDALLPRFTALLSQSKTYEEIADALDITPDQCRNIVRTRSLEGPGRGHGARHQALEALMPEILRRVENKELVVDIAASLGETPEAICRALKRRGYGVERAGPCTKRMLELDALVPQVRELVERGMRNEDIAEALGHDLTASRVRSLLHKHGITRKKKEPPA